jgi:hypothetical protein
MANPSASFMNMVLINETKEQKIRDANKLTGW